MSVIDTPPMDTMSAWATLRLQLDAKRAAETAQARADLARTPVRPRTAEDALADLQRYTAMLKVPAVIASAPLTNDIKAKAANARAELGRFRREGAR